MNSEKHTVRDHGYDTSGRCSCKAAVRVIKDLVSYHSTRNPYEFLIVLLK